MAANLKVTHYRNGESITYPDNNEAWASNTNGAYAWYNNNIEWKNIYGGLYNYYAVVNSNGLCPDGWHVPNIEEWTLLTNAIGGADSANQLKSCRQVESPYLDCATSVHPRWDYSEIYHGTNDYGFNAIPAGTRNVEGAYSDIGLKNGLWTSTEIGSGRAWARNLHNYLGTLLNDDGYMKTGNSVRCVKYNNGK
jgi:uncharacterized protein (TIGR02145 family)